MMRSPCEHRDVTFPSPDRADRVPFRVHPDEGPPPEEPLNVVSLNGDHPGEVTKEDDGDLNSWAAIDLGPYLRGEVDPVTPTVGAWREDGERMLYPGCEHSCLGEMESGKSWFALAHVASELTAGRHVVYVHFEESSPADTVSRLLALCVAPAQVAAGLTFIAPDRAVQEWDVAALVETPLSLVVLDGVNEAMSLHGQGIREEDGAAAFRRRLVKPFTRAGAAVLSLDHVVKDPDRNGQGYALGSIHKGNGLSGASFLIENKEPFGKGRRGVSHVFVVKDRPAHLRQLGRPTKVPRKFYFATMTLDATTPDVPPALRMYAPNDDEEAGPPVTGTIADVEQDVLDAVAKILAGGHDASGRAIRAASGFRASSVDTALERLVLDGRLHEREGRRRARIFTPTASQDQQKSDE
jgi:hypothetical protein